MSKAEEEEERVTYNNDSVRSPRMLAFNSISMSRFASSVSFRPS